MIEVTGADEDLRRALEDANLPVVLSVLYQLTRDEKWLSEPYIPEGVIDVETLMPDGSGRFGEAVQAEIRAGALEVFQQIRDGKRQAVSGMPDRATLQRMMNVQAGEPVPDAVGTMMLEEMGFVDRDIHLSPQASKAAADFNVIVIGAGLSGICIASKLTAEGIPYQVIEKNDQLGGTWYENQYPDCGVDTPNHFYSYSFRRNNDWSGYFSKRDELYDYVNRCATELGVREHVRLQTEVTSSTWRAELNLWEVRLKPANGKEQVVFANALVSAVGQLNRPQIPQIPGVEDFEGPLFHSARWQSHDLRGKRVGIVGVGCSAQQLLPWVAEHAKQVSVFQRSPHWSSPNPDYYRPVEDGIKWSLNHIPFYAPWNRFREVWRFADQNWPMVVKDENWPHQDRAVSALNDVLRERLTDFIKEELGERQDLLPKVLPDFPVFGRRLQLYNGWYQQLKRDNVSLICEGVKAVQKQGVITDSGEAIDLDVIIFATGFHSNLFLYPMQIKGRTGVTLAEKWGDDPRAYKGVTVPEFPNLFCLYGPNTNIVHGGSIIFQTEAAVRYIMSCISAMLDQNIAVLECKPEVNDAYNAEVQYLSERLAWGHPDVSSWYKNSQGRVVNNSPYSLHKYWAVTHDLDLGEYHIKPPQSDEAA